MCLILVSFKQNSDYPLIVAANRDEFYRRPTAALDWWQDAPDILGGADIASAMKLGHPFPRDHAKTDIVSGAIPGHPCPRGGWLCVNRHGRFAAVTNFRQPGKDSKTAKSRGLIVRRYLENALTIADFARELTNSAGDYNGYNLLFGSADELWYYNNRSGIAPAPVEPGLHVLSNAYLDTPWPKTLLAGKMFAELEGNPPPTDAVFTLLANRTQANAEKVQRTGLPLKYEVALSSIFISLTIRRGWLFRKVGYGTRASSYVTFSRTGEINFNERTYTDGKPAGDRLVNFLIPDFYRRC